MLTPEQEAQARRWNVLPCSAVVASRRGCCCTSCLTKAMLDTIDALRREVAHLERTDA
jgi:hypothetical protein